MNIMQKIFLSIILLLPLYMNGQDTALIRENPPPYDSLRLLYPFLNIQANRITGDSSALQEFFRKLQRIEHGSGEQAVIVHLGDSHVQPGVFTLPTREWIQASYGNGGRGLMFPYRMAKSNGPAGYISHCDTPWITGRNATIKRPLPTGVAGFTLWSDKPSPSFVVEFTASPYPTGDSARMSIFHSDRDTCFTFSVTNELTGRTYAVVDSSACDMTTFLLDDQPGSIRVRATRSNEIQRSATFYGMILTSASGGVIVHTIGVNGAMFSSYHESEHFATQLASLRPDLLIVSLGTNEAFGVKSYSSEGFRADINLFFSAIRQAGTRAAVLVTTPPGIYKSSRKKRRTSYKPNPVADTVSSVLRDYAGSNRMAVWDWYTIMGGKEGMSKWKAKGLTDKRYIHFSSKGYGIQGTLLREALSESYANYKPGLKNR
jgi:lysophospholipase L1-like esterase